MIKDRQGHIVKELEGQNKLLKKLYSTSAGRCALKILVSPFVTHLGGLYMSSPFSKTSISSFIKNNDIDMSQYEEKKYKSYNDLEIKDTKYQLKDLLQDETLAKEYDGGICLVFRLAVDDYHRYSYVDDGQIVSHKKIKGIFHTVNPIANDYYPIYKMNSREYTVIDSNNFGRMIQMEVGAMMVGKIVNYKHSIATKGEEKGYFEFGGSTVVMILKKDTVKIDDDIINNSSENIETRVLLGQTIGHKGV